MSLGFVWCSSGSWRCATYRGGCIWPSLFIPSVSLNHVRSFAEHVAHEDSRLRTRVVEAHPFWALLFLNNNLHIAHHAKPKLAWFQLPHVWRQMRAPALERGLVFAGGYREVTRKYLVRPYIAAWITMAADWVASLPMYDFPELRDAHDAFWGALADRLASAGLTDVPLRSRAVCGAAQVWGSPRLLFAQGCEYPLAKEFGGRVRVVAHPMYSAAGCEGCVTAVPS